MVQHEVWKTSSDVGFCRRLRGSSGTSYSIPPESVELRVGALGATLRDESSGRQYKLSLSTYTCGAVRLVVDEEPLGGRHRLQDVVLPSLEASAVEWERADAGGTGAGSIRVSAAPHPSAIPSGTGGCSGPVESAAGGGTPDATAAPGHWLSHGGAREGGGGASHAGQAAAAAVVVELQFRPFRLELSVGGVTTAVLNSRDTFAIEPTRGRQAKTIQECDHPPLSHQPGDPPGCWQESWDGCVDSKPHGPQAISLDLSFPGASEVYGLPERTASLALSPTVVAPMPAEEADQAPRLLKRRVADAQKSSKQRNKRASNSSSTGGHIEPYRLYNLDVFEYEERSNFGLYGSIPVMLAHQVGLTVGAFWLNASEMYVDVERRPAPDPALSTHWMAESGVVDLFLFPGPRPADVLQQYASVTGGTAMPQLFSLGYHQCRWNYDNEADVVQVNANFDRHEIPYDVLWLDIEHTNGKRYLTWDKKKFPSPIRMQESLAAAGRKTVTIVDPHVKRDPNYWVHAEAERLGYYVKDAGGTRDFKGSCWPGQSSYLDVTSLEVRQWWGQQYALDKYPGSTRHLYIWNDMNEPSVFDGPEMTMQKDVRHAGGVEHRDVHNVYGMLFHLATAEGLKARGRVVRPGDGDRPFVLSRAFFAGDNAATWGHLQMSVPMLLTLGLTGMTHSGADVGGFFGNPSIELLTRWYQLAAYTPFFRGHAHLDTARREPWLFGRKATSRIRAAINNRYALIAYMYTLFWDAHVAGQPVMRPLWFEFPDDAGTFTTEEEFMLGPALLIHPVTAPNATSVTVQLPGSSTAIGAGTTTASASTNSSSGDHVTAAAAGKTIGGHILGGTSRTRWYDALSGAEVSSSTAVPGQQDVHQFHVNMECIPFFYRGGYIVPRQARQVRSTVELAGAPFTLIVALDSAQEAEGLLYLDDGTSYAYERGAFLRQRFAYCDGVLSAGPSSMTERHAGEGVKPAMKASAAGHDSAAARAAIAAEVAASPYGQAIVERVVFLGLPSDEQWQAVVEQPGNSAGQPAASTGDRKELVHAPPAGAGLAAALGFAGTGVALAVDGLSLPVSGEWSVLLKHV